MNLRWQRSRGGLPPLLQGITKFSCGGPTLTTRTMRSFKMLLCRLPSDHATEQPTLRLTRQGTGASGTASKVYRFEAGVTYNITITHPRRIPIGIPTSADAVRFVRTDLVAPEALFAADKVVGGAPVAVQFSDRSRGTVSSRSLEFWRRRRRHRQRPRPTPMQTQERTSLPLPHPTQRVPTLSRTLYGLQTALSISTSAMGMPKMLSSSPMPTSFWTLWGRYSRGTTGSIRIQPST